MIATPSDFANTEINTTGLNNTFDLNRGKGLVPGQASVYNFSTAAIANAQAI